jgi:hypothetical protein
MQVPVTPNWLSIVETTVKILAVFFAGGWAVFLLIALRRITTARVQLEKIQAERDKTAQDVQKTQREIQELDLKLKVQPVIRSNIITSTQRTAPQSGWLLFATVDIVNTGNAPARLVYEEGDPFLVTAVDFDAQGQPVFARSTTLRVPQARDPNSSALATIIRAGGQESLPFVLRLERPGLYFLSFRAQLCSADRESLEGLGIPEWRPVSWTAKHYASVE